MSSNRLLIARGIVALLAGITNPNTGQPVFALTKLGAVLDPSPYASFAEVVDPRGKVGHEGSGGNSIGWRIKDNFACKVTCGWIYELDTSQAMINMLTAQDIVLPIFLSHYQIPNPDNPSVPIASVYSLLEDQEQTDMSLPIRFPNGHIMLLWSFWVLAKQSYNITIISP